MLNAKDLELLAAKGIGEKQIEEQLACFVKGFPFLEIRGNPLQNDRLMANSRKSVSGHGSRVPHAGICR